MWKTMLVLSCGLMLADGMVAANAGEGCSSCSGCVDGGCVARCKARWDEAKTKKPEYSIRCEYACDRAHDPWHAPDPDCRRHPPQGRLYVKKRLYKTEKEEVERVPKYDVETVAAPTCSCDDCSGGDPFRWDPLRLPLWRGW